MTKCILISLCAGTGLIAPSIAGADEPKNKPARVHRAVTKSIVLIQQSSMEYLKHRQCFSCHHQAMPLLTLTEAKKHGFDVDDKNLKAQINHTYAHLKRGYKNYLKARGQGGRVDTAGYALWALFDGGRKGDEVTTAVTEYLLRTDVKLGHWKRAGFRPPSEASDVTSTAAAIYALNAYGNEKQKIRIAERKKTALAWLLRLKPKDTEDRVFRLKALSYLGAKPKTIKTGIAELIQQQQSDGGWAQKSKMKCDAYATGTVLTTLHIVGAIDPSSKCYQDGVDFLLNNQKPDGSWHVKSRSRPFQTYFESGFPHGKDQFISITASCWATQALIYAAHKTKKTTCTQMLDQ